MDAGMVSFPLTEAGLNIRSEDIRRMGVGGLLIEKAAHLYPGIAPLGASIE
jgi:hypothetical protein